MLIDRLEGALEVVAILLAEGVEVQTAEALEIGLADEFGRAAEAGAWGAGVVEGVGAGGAAGIDAQAAAEFAGLEARVGHDPVAEAVPLAGGVEIEVGAEGEEGVDIGGGVGRGAGEDVFAEVLVGELGFPGAGGTAAVEMLPHDGEGLGQGEGLEGVDDVAGGGVLDLGEEGAVRGELFEIDDEGGGRRVHDGALGDPAGVAMRKAGRSAQELQDR